MLEWSWPAWLISVAAVAASGAVAALEGHWSRARGLDIGFGTHGGMWSDALLLSALNALVVPWIGFGRWLFWTLAAGAAGTVALHAWWHGGHGAGFREHMWPARPTGRWYADLSWAGWCHVVYVAFEVALFVAYVATPDAGLRGGSGDPAPHRSRPARRAAAAVGRGATHLSRGRVADHTGHRRRLGNRGGEDVGIAGRSPGAGTLRKADDGVR